MRRHSTDDTTTRLANSGTAFDDAYRRLVTSRFTYEGLRGDARRVPALAAARADLDAARREVADLRLQRVA